MRAYTIIRFCLVVLFFCMASTTAVQAQYRLRFRVYENEQMCGCQKEGVLVRVDGSSLLYFWSYTSSNGSHQYDLNLPYDPRAYQWRYEHIPATPSVCVPMWQNCWFVGTNSSLPIYSGPNYCGVTEYDIPPTSNNIRGLFIVIEFVMPQSAPTLLGGGELTNLCSESVTIQTAEKNPIETYTWEVCRTLAGPTVNWKTFATTTGNTVDQTVISRDLLNQKMEDGLSGSEFHVRVRASASGNCAPAWGQRTSPPALVTFTNSAPASFTAAVTPPQCPGGVNGKIEVSALKNADGSDFVSSDALVYTLSNGINNYQVSSATGTAVFGQPVVNIGAGTYTVQIENGARTCSSPSTNPPIIVANPPSLGLVQAAVSQPIKCSAGQGAISTTVENGLAPFTYEITGGFSASSGSRNYTFLNLVSGNYIVKVTDACGQSVSSTMVNLGEPNSVVTIQSLDAQNASCSGQNDGRISANFFGGTATYSVQLDGGAFIPANGGSHLFTGLAAGNHSVSVRDANNCLVSGNTTINFNDPVQGEIQSTDILPVTCAGTATGGLTIHGMGGSGIYEYSINGVTYQTFGQFGGLSAGTYAVSVRDQQATACRWNGTVVITEPLPMVLDNFSVSKTIDCFGSNTGELTASASGGMPSFGYTYHLLGLHNGHNESHTSSLPVSFDHLTADDYQLIVTDGVVNCSVTTTITVTQPNQLAFHPTLSDYHGHPVSCASSSDGIISISSLGGIYPHRISIAGRPDQVITHSGETAVFANFQAGDYFFTITDHSGSCEKDTLIRLLAPPVVALTLTVKQKNNGHAISCHGTSDGVLSSKAAGGTMPYSYSITPSNASYNQVMQDSVSFSNLAAGGYTVLLKDVNDCSIQKTMTLTEPEVLLVSHIVKPDIAGYQVKCKGDQDALVTVFTAGGSYPQVLTLNNPVQQGTTTNTTTGVSFSNLGAGGYTVSILDAEGCTATENFSLVEPAAVTLDNTQTLIEKPDCAGQQTGSLQVQAIGGIGSAYDYQLTYLGDRSYLPFPYPEVQTLHGALINFNLLIAGSYQLQLTDEVGCVATSPVNILTNNQVKDSLSSVTGITCKSDQDGSAVLYVSGGVAPYEVHWKHQFSTIQTDAGIAEKQPVQIQELKEGLYNYEISDANGCAIYNTAFTLQIEGPSEALILGAVTTTVSCHGDNNGMVLLESKGGWQTGAYLYGTSLTGLSSTVTVYEDLSPGVYTYYTKDSKGCVDTLEVTMTEPDVLQSLAPTTHMVSCHGLANGSAQLNLQGGTLPYQWSIDNGTTWVPGTQLTLLPAATYAVKIRDAHLCSANQSVTITEPEVLLAKLLNQVNTLCQQATGSATVNVSGGSAPYEYTWSKDHAAFSDQLSISNLAAGTYLFHVEDDHACTHDLPVTIINANDIVFDVQNIQGVNCYGESNGKAEINISTIQSPYTIAWSNGASTPSVATLSAGTNEVTLEDANHCKVSKTFTVPTPTVLAIASIQKNSPSCFGVCDGSIAVSATGGTGTYSYAWSNGTVNNTLFNICAGDYTLKLEDQHHCIVQQVISLTGPVQHTLGIEDTTYYICQGQKVDLNLTPWIHPQWSSDNGFTSTSPSVSLTQAGSYHVKATDNKGCEGQANFSVVYSADILKSEFLVPKETYVGDTIVCVSISKPQPDVLTWKFDQNKAIDMGHTGAYQQLVFLEEGSFVVTLVSNMASCRAEQSKTILVLKSKTKGEPSVHLGYEETGIKDVNIYPNPNDGLFTCEVLLYKSSDIEINVVDLYGKLLTNVRETNNDHFNSSVSIEGQPPGLYWLVVKSGDDVKTVKVVIK